MSDEFTSSDPRCLAVLAKLAKARDGMKRRGTKLLIEDRPAWQTIKPRGVVEPAKVIEFKRRRK